MNEAVVDQEIRDQLESLRQSLPEQIPIDLVRVFPKRSGMGWKGDMKMRCKLLAACQSYLQHTLKEGEEVIYIGKGVQQKFTEQYFLGIWAQFINQTVFVFTNLRVILLNSNTKGVPKHTFWSIYYCEISQFKGGMLGGATMKLKDGSKFKYSGFKGVDRKKIPEVVEAARADYEQMGFNPESSQSRENLCSRCIEIVPKNQYECSNCQQKFFTPKELAIRSLIFPSWGDFSMGHTMLAVVELLGYLVSWLVIAGFVASAIAAGGWVVAIAVAACILVFEHVVDAILTYYLAKKGLTPKRG